MIIELKPVRNGETWDGISDCSFSSTGTAFANTLAAVEIRFLSSDGATEYTRTSAAGQITITNSAANQWKFDINAFEMTYAADTWSFAIKTTDSAGIKKIRATGTLPVTSTFE